MVVTVVMTVVMVHVARANLSFTSAIERERVPGFPSRVDGWLSCGFLEISV